MSDAQDIIETAQLAVEPTRLEPGQVYLVMGEDGNQRVVDTLKYSEHPARTIADREVRDIRSFLTYLDKHSVEGQTEVYADPTTSKIVAVIDAHGPAGTHAGNQAHVLSLGLVHTNPWLKWKALDGKELTQLQFANFIEENAADIMDPTPATMLELAQHFQGATKVDWKSGQRLANGQVQLGYEETVEARAGQKGDLEIPAEFAIVLRPYVGGEPYKVRARFRYRLAGGNVHMTYLLDRPEAVLENAFQDIVNVLQIGIPSENVVVREGGDGVQGLELALPAVSGHTPVLVGKPSRA